MTALLEADNITKVFGSGVGRRTETVALRDFTFRIDTGRPLITGVVGESGSGKSTMARLLLGLESPTKGAVRYRGTNLRSLSRGRLRAFRREVQAVFQDPFESFNSFYRVDHMLEMPIRKFKLARSKTEARQLIRNVLDAVGLRPEETLGRFPHQLSGGQRQRVMVARALLLDPKLIIADEPVSMIDASLRATVLTALRKLRDDFGISLVYITHDLTTAFQICDDIIVLYRGYVAEVGDITKVVKEPKHPYTQLLVSSIPRPDPDSQWSEEPEPSELATGADPDEGCLFAARWPHAVAPCLKTIPQLYRTDPRRAATCYLYQDAPVLALDQMDELLMGAEEETQPEGVRQPAEAGP
jgi:oligopeptide/dipeptide ABC transporter ATP-binding protein